MSLFVLDTDHLSLYSFQEPTVVRQVLAHGFEELAITIVNVEEQLTGWYTRIRQARNDEKRARAYEALFQAVELIKEMRILPFTPADIQRAGELRKQFRRMDKMDLAIAAIVLEHDATLVTRNRSDFQQIPGLRIEDWSQP